MAVTPYVHGYSFSGYEAANPTSPKPGNALDVEFLAIERAISELRAYVGVSSPAAARIISAESSFPFTADLTTEDVILVTVPLTAERVIVIPDLSAFPAATIDIGRTSASTGAFNLVVKDHLGGVIATLAANAIGNYARIGWDGAAFTVAYSTGGSIGRVSVTQLRIALGTAGKFYDVNNAISVSPGSLLYEFWNSGGSQTGAGDDLYDAVVDAVGATAADAAYSAALSVTL